MEEEPPPPADGSRKLNEDAGFSKEPGGWEKLELAVMRLLFRYDLSSSL